MTVGQFRAIGQKVKDGVSLTEDERQQYAKGQEAIKSAIKGVQERYAGVAAQLESALIKLPDVLEQFGQWTRAVLERLSPVLAEVATEFQEMPPKLRSALLTLGDSGWYLDGEMAVTDLWELERLLLAGSAAEVDQHLTRHFEQRLSDIETILFDALPRRERILRAAFAAHRRGEFELSVPVLLAQSDGACLDLTGYYLFLKEAGKPQVARHVDATTDAVSAAMLSPLVSVLPINASEKDRNRKVQDQRLARWRELNRHLVLHGESVDYGTQVNSLKAVSLINYLVGSLGRPKAP